MKKEKLIASFENQKIDLLRAKDIKGNGPFGLTNNSCYVITPSAGCVATASWTSFDTMFGQFDLNNNHTDKCS